jgi:type II secretory pathway predicted ATPase ExeA
MTRPVYEEWYGLRERPFDLSSDPRFMQMTPGHVEALGNLDYGIEARRGIILLVGEAGTGKTMVLRHALTRRDEERSPIAAAHLENPTLSRQDFFEFLGAAFGLTGDYRTSKTSFLRQFEQTLRERQARDERCVLVIDEAQSLPHELLEELRLLANMESGSDKLLTVVLSGQPELAARLNEPSLRQLKQRISLRCSLAPLSLQQTAAFMAGRIRSAGGDPGRIFSRDAVMAVHHHARGIPRLICILGDNALLSGFALGRLPVDGAIVEQVGRDFDLNPPAGRPGPTGGHEMPAAPPSANLRTFPTVQERRGWSLAVAERLTQAFR